MKSMRNEFANLMLEMSLKDEDLIVLVGDISHGILKPFAKKNPSKYYNVGICEPTIVNMAAGLSKVGLLPIVHTIAPFMIERCYEQIKLDFGYQKLPVNFISIGGAFDYSKLGCSHHCYTDLSILNHIENSNIFLPGSSKEFRILFKMNYKNGAINYFKLSDFSHNYNFDKNKISSGKGIKIISGTDVTLVTTGSILKNVIEAKKIVESKNISAEIIYYHTLKPFDKNIIFNSVKKTRKLISIEEHSHADGLYNLVLQSLANNLNFKSKQMAINGFIRGYGTYKEMQKKAGLSIEDIVSSIEKIVQY